MNTPETRLTVMAPLSGVLLPLEHVPDPVFAQKMVGDGISLDPTTNELLAPVSGKITQLHDSHHALTILTDSGIELLVHIGVDTVMLKGAGFEPLVKMGDYVATGQALIRFDADVVAKGAISLQTQIVVANGDLVASMHYGRGKVVAGKDPVLVLTLVQANQVRASGDKDGSECSSEIVSLPNPAGLHARPAAVLAAAAKQFQSDVRLVRGEAEANAKSLVAIMALSTKQGDQVQIKAIGSDSAEAVRHLHQLLIAGCGEDVNNAPQPAEAVVVNKAQATSPNELAGVSASPGLAVGKIVQYRHAAIQVKRQGGSVEQEQAALKAALNQAAAQLEQLKSSLADKSKAQILAAHQGLLEDPDLLDAAQAGITAQDSAAYAWREAFTRFAVQLEALPNPLLQERAQDVRDVGRRVLSLLAGVEQAQIEVPENSILIAEELTPSDTASLDRNKVCGFCTTTGGATSHVAILARSLGIPAICGIDGEALSLHEGSLVILDGSRGILHKQPSEDEVASARGRMAQQAARHQEEMAQAFAPAVTTDGHAVEVVANVRNAAETQAGMKNGAEGVGLLRSEFLFDERDTAPSQAEQAEEYIAVARAVGAERPLVIRTLDVGGDKPLPYLPLPKEENPFLGLRGIRVSLDRPELFRTQLRAILQAAPFTRLHIMFPMIASLDELRQAKAILAEEQAACAQHDVKVGVMIEVPSAALLAEQLAQEADFFSIGTNDLTQYTLAMDRGHPKLAKQADGLHPAVLKMIALTCEGAHKHGKWVGVCGGMASDLMAVPVLLGLGVDELSVSVPAIAAVKAQVKRLSLTQCQTLAQEILQMGTVAQVRERLSAFAE